MRWTWLAADNSSRRTSVISSSITYATHIVHVLWCEVNNEVQINCRLIIPWRNGSKAILSAARDSTQYFVIPSYGNIFYICWERWFKHNFVLAPSGFTSSYNDQSGTNNCIKGVTIFIAPYFSSKNSQHIFTLQVPKLHM